MTRAELEAAMAPLEPGYADLLDLVVATVRDDDGVRAVWVCGSVGRGTADAGSDLDLVLTVRDVAEFADPSVWAALDPVVTIAIPGLPGSFALTTRGGLRLDLVVESVADLARTPYRHRVAVLDGDGLEVPAPVERDGPDLGAMAATVTEFFRQTAIFPAAVVARDDWLLGQVAVHQYALLLYQLLAESNEPLPPMGVKQWSSRLTEPQRAVLAALPQPLATRKDVVDAMVAVRDALLTHGRDAVEGAGGVWPADTAEAMAGYWRRHGLPWSL